MVSWLRLPPEKTWPECCLDSVLKLSSSPSAGAALSSSGHEGGVEPDAFLAAGIGWPNLSELKAAGSALELLEGWVRSSLNTFRMGLCKAALLNALPGSVGLGASPMGLVADGCRFSADLCAAAALMLWCVSSMTGMRRTRRPLPLLLPEMMDWTTDSVPELSSLSSGRDKDCARFNDRVAGAEVEARLLVFRLLVEPCRRRRAWDWPWAFRPILFAVPLQGSTCFDFQSSCISMYNSIVF